MLLDIALGLLVAYFVPQLYGLEVQHWHYVLGMMFVLFPDIDALYHYYKTKEVAAYAASPVDHRDGLHYPATYLVLGVLVTTIMGVLLDTHELPAMFASAGLLHFVHDSIGVGWGVKWLHPFSTKNYKLFSEKDGTWSTRLLVGWDEKELCRAIVLSGDPEWIQNFFVRPLVRLLTLQGFPPVGLTIFLTAEVFLPIFIILCFVL